MKERTETDESISLNKSIYEKTSTEMMDFISKSPSCYHVIDNLKVMLNDAGYEEVQEENLWKLSPGGKYYVTRNDSSIIAFLVPSFTFRNFQIAASHSDSPSFKVKENPEMLVDGQYVELNTEKYGGMLCAPWFDRPLSVAGRVIVENDNRLESRLVHIDRDLLMMPNVAIHMNRKANDGYTYNAQKDMIPLFGMLESKDQFMNLVAESAGVDSTSILGSDLFLYNRMPGTIWGADREFISSTKLDDLQCAYTTMQAHIHADNQSAVTVCCVFDNEEVGSGTKQGADSTFLQDVLERICYAAGKSKEGYQQAVAGSFMLSADNAHAVHPNHLDVADPTNRPYLNQGVVIKYNANQKYTTDAVSAALFKAICKAAEVPVQTYVNRSDVAGGSTLGNIANAHVSLNTVDIGIAQLAMHSPYETAGVKDTYYMEKAVEAFFRTEICKCGSNYDLQFKAQ